MNSFSIHSISMELIIKCQITRKHMHQLPSMLQSNVRRCWNISVVLLTITHNLVGGLTAHEDPEKNLRILDRIYHTHNIFNIYFMVSTDQAGG
jgi:hypothetical protein